MGRKAISGGVTNFRGKCRVDFKYEGQRYQPVLDLEYNARNVRATQKMMEIVRAKIEHGVFDPAVYFPDYAGLKRMAVATTSASAKTFADYAEVWQASISEKAAATREDYRKILNRVWLPALRDRPIASIRYSDLLAVLSDYPAMTGKTRNNNLIPLRGVFALAKKDHAINDDPAAELENSKVQVPEPDPFELHEVEQILADLAAHTPAPVVNYFTAAFFTGIRPSELIAIRWADVDFNRRAVRVQRAIVRGKAKATTKTNTVRDVDLNDRALAAFEAQRKHTQLKGGQVFSNPATNKPWADIQMQWEIWNLSLRRCKLRYRVPYQTRHTYATLALHLAGARPGYVARQLGHANTGMLFKVYSKWIDGADNQRERAKLDAAFVHDLCTARRDDSTTA